MTAGRLIAVVGPSGVGKDSVMSGLAAALPGLRRVRRVITRDPTLGGEAFEPVTEAEFARRRDAGAFCLHWRAHGLRYGIPADVRAATEAGTDCLVNLSRGALAEAYAAFPRLFVLNITARPETLAHRLAGRGREAEAEIARRLSRRGAALPPGLDVVTIANDGPLDDTIRAALRALQPVSP